MFHPTRDILGQSAYLQRQCEVLIDRLKQLEGLVSGAERLAPMPEGEMFDANSRWGNGAKDHVELALQYVEEWHRRVDAVLRMGAPPYPY